VVDDRLIAFAVVALEGLQGLVGEDHAEAEGVVRPVALEHGDARVGPGLLHQDREIEAGRTAADDVHLHGRLHEPKAPPPQRGTRPRDYFKLKVIRRQWFPALEREKF
jgi:hypothetical protein